MHTNSRKPLARACHLLRCMLNAFCLLSAICLPLIATASCDLKVTSAYTCDANGNAYAPQVGDTYFIRINWTVTGQPNAPYTVRFTMANFSWDWKGVNTGPGSYWGYAGFNLPLDGKIPYSITLDPTHVTGDTNYANNTIKGKFTPVPPSAAIEYFNPLTWNGSETFTINWYDGGTVTNGFTLMGCPVSDSFQQVVKANGPAGSQQISTQPTGDPVWQHDYYNFSPTPGHDTWSDTQTFTVTCSASRVNQALLRRATWSQLAGLPPKYTVWTQPDSWVQSNDPAIAAFVDSVIPAYQLPKMTPYDAARKLYSAIVGRTTYVEPAPYIDAVDVLNGKQGDCGGFSDLICACLRHIGIPSRTICGWWQGQNQWHCMAEFYLPNCGWVVADGSQCKVWFDSTGKYAYCFGAHTYCNTFCAVSRGTDHYTSNFAVTELQVGWFYYWGNASYASFEDTCSLQ